MMRRLLCVLFAITLTTSAQQPVQLDQQVFVTAIDVVADVRDKSGKVPQRLTPADFILIEEGVERTIVGVDYLRVVTPAKADPSSAGLEPSAAASPLPGPVWQIVLYFETQLTSGISRKRAVEALLPHVDELVSRGRVDVVFASPEPAALVRNSRDPQAIRDALRKIAAQPGLNQLANHRRQFYQESQSVSTLQAMKDKSPPVIVEIGKPPQPQPNFDAINIGSPVMVEASVVRPFIDTEVQLISRFRNSLLGWLGSYRRHVPRTLFLVTDGFDVDPLAFYTAHVNKTDQASLRVHLTQSGLGDVTDRMMNALAAAGWSTVSVPGDPDADGWVDDASQSGMARAHLHRGPTPRSYFQRPAEPLNAMAEATGGRVVPNAGKIGEVIDELDNRVKLTYQVDRRPDGKPRKIEVRARNRDLTVRSVRWASSSTPDEIAENRALGLLRASNVSGDLPVESSVEWNAGTGRRSGTLRAVARLDLVRQVLPTARRGEFRFTLGVQVPPNRAFVVNRVLSDYDMSSGVFQVRTPIDVPADASQILVVIEELSTGLWGSARVEMK